MAKKNSAGGVLIVIGLFILAIGIKYWYVFLAISAVALLIWGIGKLTKSSSIREIPAVSGSDPKVLLKSSVNISSRVGPTAKLQQIMISSPEDVWIPRGCTIHCSDYSIKGGLVYFGSGLRSIQGWGAEPSLIDPNLHIDKSNPDREGRYMNYWPNYSQIHPASRAAFLEWLADGRKDPGAYIGYVFIYFYGLERRVLADSRKSSAAKNDIALIIAEVERLLSIYGENNSFRSYADNFLDKMRLTQLNDTLYLNSPQIAPHFSEMPLTLKVALGQMAKDAVPVTSEWALAWAQNDPEMPRRMPSQRCQSEFSDLFKVRYSETFGEGLKLKPNKSRIQASYQPASPSFGGNIQIPAPDLPDVTKVTGPSSKIKDLVNSCIDELEGYSRFIGRNPDGRNSIEALAYLPQPLLKKSTGKDFQYLIKWLDEKTASDDLARIAYSSLLHLIPSIKMDTFGKKEATAIAGLLGKINYGIEPDPRFGNFICKPDNDVVVFKLGENAAQSPSAEYKATTLILHLAASVAHADGSVDSSEELYLMAHLEESLRLASDDKIRLKAHIQWLLSSCPGMAGIKKRIELLSQNERESIGRFLVSLAQADGYIDPAEMNILTRIYQMLSLDLNSLYSHAHNAAIKPVTIKPADFTISQGYMVPAQKTSPERKSLDMNTIEAKLSETAAVSAILCNIFADEESEATKTMVSKIDMQPVPITGLDSESFGFMKVLASKNIWHRLELEKLAADKNLMLDGTLDRINDASFDHFGGPFFEGDDPIEVNIEFAREISL
jgi:tellurite resistance protein